MQHQIIAMLATTHQNDKKRTLYPRNGYKNINIIKKNILGWLGIIVQWNNHKRHVIFRYKVLLHSEINTNPLSFSDALAVT